MENWISFFGQRKIVLFFHKGTCILVSGGNSIGTNLELKYQYVRWDIRFLRNAQKKNI